MSKPISGHFKGTTGTRKSSDKTYYKHDIIADRVLELDLREHPTKLKQLSHKKRKELYEKIRKRTITKQEYKHLDWNRRLDARRQEGVKRFWKQERKRIQHNLPTTRNWNSEQRADILKRKTPTFQGKKMIGHHTYSVAKYPHLANKGEVIYPATHYEHHQGWHGGNYRESLPGMPIKKIKQF